METLKPSMHHRLGNVTVAAGFSWGKQLEFRMGEIQKEQYSFTTEKQTNKQTNKRICLEFSAGSHVHSSTLVSRK